MGKNLFAEQDKLFDFIERKRERERKRNEVLKLQEEKKRAKQRKDKRASMTIKLRKTRSY